MKDLSVQEANILNLSYFRFPLMLYIMSDVVVVSDSYHLHCRGLVEGIVDCCSVTVRFRCGHRNLSLTSSAVLFIQHSALNAVQVPAVPLSLC